MNGECPRTCASTRAVLLHTGTYVRVVETKLVQEEEDREQILVCMYEYRTSTILLYCTVPYNTILTTVLCIHTYHTYE